MNIYDLTGFLVHRTDVKMTNYFMRKLSPYQITPEQWGIISVLDTERAVNQKQLAEAIDRDQTTVVRMIHSLERKEMIKKITNLEDKRSHHLYLSEKGSHIKKELLQTVQEAHDYVTRGFTAEEREQLQSFLNRLYDNVKDEG
ncbi:MarR family winged helix-turn-helix transcriptional regulator [Paenibacillus hunanensis]|uniref:DNA-binding MarR family transcriptional regulator n=1 Tax=Paenibacillus hunanensis TaxID=539262 RepID=A0ABU1J2C2_9BACL|nr:MarR family transcriptional regulator [Paenibacillus hunanensis]MDR6245672.1 DNA-binding MarR family transcriptional regulator [Paenibacillus hunanensis]WPP43374.1 MarR family transcriptional regulator [Paenibacillus hunanensis]GGJ28162.1 MarR family transcriptional regulator [Paenibacillus hunanensis]